MLLIGSPMCTAFSILQRINFKKKTQEVEKTQPETKPKENEKKTKSKK